MLHIVPLLAAAALVLLPLASSARLPNKLDVDNSLKPHGARQRHLHKFLKIRTPPPDSVAVVPGQQAELLCEVIGSPGPSVSWLKNGEPYVDYEEEANEVLSMHPSSIVHVKAKLLVSDAIEGDVYTCFASGIKQDSASTTIVAGDAEDPDSLLAKFLIPPKPVITFSYPVVFQDEGSTIILPCRIEETGQIYWEQNDKSLMVDNSRLRVLPSGDLLIQGLRWSDMGQYTCVARNEFGEDSASTFLYPLKPSNS